MSDCSFELNNKPISDFKMGASSFPAFSGLGKHINNPISECLPHSGPIPRGNYYIFDRQSGGLFGKLKEIWEGKEDWFALYAIDDKIDDEMYCEEVKRGLFRLHYGSPASISQGCITISTWTCYQVLNSMLKSSETIEIPDMGLECYGKVKVW